MCRARGCNNNATPPPLTHPPAELQSFMTPLVKRQKTCRFEQRKLFVCTYLTSGGDLAAAQRASGLTDPHALQRLGKLVLETGGLADRPRSGRKRKYTADHCAAAQQELVTSPQPYTSTAKLVGKLSSNGELPARAKPRPFVRRFKQHLATQHLKLVHGQRSRPFALNSHHERKREKWCLDNLEELSTEEGLRARGFADETTVEESPHPKGEPACT